MFEKKSLLIFIPVMGYLAQTIFSNVALELGRKGGCALKKRGTNYPRE